MSFWKKVFKKYKKEKKQDSEGLVEDKYFQKLQKKLSEHDIKHKKKK
jgi:hypothetical protein